jgi:hypothetical protein
MGRLAQLVRAPALQAGGRRFESCTAHHSLVSRTYKRKLSGYIFGYRFRSVFATLRY